MNKLLLFSVFLLLFFGTVYSAPCITGDVIVQLEDPANNEMVSQGENFTMQGIAIAPGGDCEADIYFEYDEGSNGANFYRIKDSSYTPPSGLEYIVAPFSSGDSTFFDNQPITMSGTTIPITIKCNSPGTYQLMFSAYTTDSASILNSDAKTIYCSANAPPTGYFISPAVSTVLYRKTGNGDSFDYTIEWDAEDSEGEPITSYDLTVFKKNASGTFDSYFTHTTPNKIYNVTISDYGEFYFSVEFSDGVNTTVIESEHLFVAEPVNTLSVSELIVFPEAVYGDAEIDINLTVRNYSSEEVDINVFYFHSLFPGGSYEQSVKNVLPFSTAKFHLNHDFLDSNPVDYGDYNIRIVIQDYLAGTDTKNNDVPLQVFAHFVVLMPNTPVSLNETNWIAVILVCLSVVLIVRKKS